jgi:MoxR-like ATPase
VDDLKASALPSLRHRLLPNFEGQAEGIDLDDIIGEALAQLETRTKRDVPV